MKLDVYNQDGKKTSTKVELNDKIFGIEPKDHAIWLDVKAIMASKRQGTHATKGRSYVSGGGRKPFRQKGTGRARQGSTRAPHHVGGGRVFGPSPRVYYLKINKKVKVLARKSALSYKARDNKIVVVEDFSYESPSTKKLKGLLEALELNNKPVLLCTSDNSPSVVKSASNMYRVEVRDSIAFSTYDIMRADTVIMQKSAVDKVNEVLGR
ncbi:MAG: 50S ribosomal protein L4 [Calditrichaceae bacterium]|nr:50S ribosomal protein L4 [Calditrichaceae bacterium]MBN2709100.1 50S ribosomal protein L4 [Calditrichaceae bacterium]RQV97057.1 MAG: 50S ribosomal protein L4 [Calditrichota bacterium]